jgi:hypothetical protein
MDLARAGLERVAAVYDQRNAHLPPPIVDLSQLYREAGILSTEKGATGFAMLYLPKQRESRWETAMPELSAEELETRVNEEHVAALVTLNEDGSPHVAPVWYLHRAGSLQIVTSESYAKTRNIRRDPRVALSIASDSEPYWYVVFEGEATIDEQNVEQSTFDICIRYQGEEAGAAYARELLAESGTVVLRISPTHIKTWKDDEF